MRLRFENAIWAGPFGPARHALIITFSLFFFIITWLSGNRMALSQCVQQLEFACKHARRRLLKCYREMDEDFVKSPRLKNGEIPTPDKFQDIC
jgi:hypothetical protein